MARPTTTEQRFILYVKTHNITKMKYLGKTESKDPHAYNGSGKYWKRHLKKYGYDYTTEILLVTKNKEEIKETGLFFSKLWNVVESKEWANLKLEEGDGGWSHINTKEDYLRRSESFKGDKNPMFGKRGEKSPIFGTKQSLDHKEKRIEKIKGRNHTEASKKLMSVNHTKKAIGMKWFHNPCTKHEKRFFIGLEDAGYLPGRISTPNTKGMKKYVNVNTGETKMFFPEEVDATIYKTKKDMLNGKTY
jgi:hypothetical protein